MISTSSLRSANSLRIIAKEARTYLARSTEVVRWTRPDGTTITSSMSSMTNKPAQARASSSSEVTTHLSYATAFSDFLSPMPATILSAPATAPQDPTPSTNLSYSSPFADFAAPSQQEIHQSILSADEVHHSEHISYSSPFSDFAAPTLQDIARSTQLYPSTPAHNTNHLSFATPFADLLAPTHQELTQTKASEPTHLSFASPYSDSCSPHISPAPVSTHAAVTMDHLSWASPTADFLAPHHQELTAELESQPRSQPLTQYSFSSPYQDFVSHESSSLTQSIFDANAAILQLLSFTSPEADFCVNTALPAPLGEDLVHHLNTGDVTHEQYSFASALADFYSTELIRDSHTLETHRPMTEMMSFSSPESDFLVANLDLGAPVAPRAAFDGVARVELLRGLPMTVEAALKMEKMAVVVTESQAPFRITHVNQAWVDMCGYSKEEAVGSTLEMIQGPKTCEKELRALSQRVKQHERHVARLVNYKKNQQHFENLLRVGPLRSQTGKVTHLVGILEEVGNEMKMAV